jgi:hypothetical protein
MKPACSDYTDYVKIKLRSGWMERSSAVRQEFLHNVANRELKRNLIVKMVFRHKC